MLTTNSSNRLTQRVRSFVRHGRKTAGQKRAYHELWENFGLRVDAGLLSCQPSPFLEIGFGSGQSLLAAATAMPATHFIGVETHKPGIGALFYGLQQRNLTNVRVYDADAIDVLERCIPDTSLQGVLIFFPDPWPKRRHHLRRLIQPAFIQLVISKLVPSGILHLATDWEDYAMHMLKVVSATSLINVAGESLFASRSPYRPLLTKFERRALAAGRKIWDLQLTAI